MPSLVDPPVAPGLLSSAEQPVLAAGSIALRPWTENHVDAVVAAYQEPEIQRWHVRSMTPEEALGWIEDARSAWSEGSGASWAVEDRGALAGRMTLKLRPSYGFATAAYWTRGPSRGRGVAPRSLDLAVEWAFSLGMNRVELKHSTLNPASCRVACKAGFAPEGTRRGAGLHADGWHDMHLHGRIREESTGRLPGLVPATQPGRPVR